MIQVNESQFDQSGEKGASIDTTFKYELHILIHFT